MSMRNEALRTLEELAAVDDRIVFLTGDLGFGVVEPFFERFPERSFNVGVAEQGMVAIATGLAEAGLLPFVYSIAPFATLRPFEFIRNGPVFQGLPVRIMGVGGGMEYGINGPSHYALEDVGVLRTLPGLTIIAPADRAQARAAIEATWDVPGPVYYRLSKFGTEAIEGLDGRWDEGGVQVTREGSGAVCLIAMGAAATELAPAAAELAALGLDVTTAVASRLASAPTEAILALAEANEIVVTLESHFRVGGLGSMVCEVVAEAGLDTRVARCAVDHPPLDEIGTASYLAGVTATDRHALVAAAVAASRAKGLAWK